MFRFGRGGRSSPAPLLKKTGAGPVVLRDEERQGQVFKETPILRRQGNGYYSQVGVGLGNWRKENKRHQTQGRSVALRGLRIRNPIRRKKWEKVAKLGKDIGSGS